MLPICFGEATKFSQFLLESDKAYCVTVQLGEKTSTGDGEGEVIERAPSNHVTHSALQAAMQQMQGQIEQTPPMFSAIKHQGQPLYVLARKGIEIARAARLITIYDFTLLDLTDDQFTCFIKCSKGTYVRTLIEDCVKRLNTVAYVSALHREYVLPYVETDMFTMSALERIKMQQGGEVGLQSLLLPISTMMQTYPTVTLSAASAFYFRKGQTVRTISSAVEERAQVVTEQGEFLGVGIVLRDGRLRPERLLAEEGD
jgi:tRNA pseudouridine55 synthase